MTFRFLVAGAATALAVLLLPSAAAAAPAYPAADGRCVDTTDTLGAELCAWVTTILEADERVTSDEIAVAVVPTTGDRSIGEWSTGLFNRWGVGAQHKDNGVLLVVAVDDREVRLVTGTGMAKRLPDAQAGDIVDASITPRFRAGDQALGILSGLDEVRRAIGHEVTADNALEPLAGKATSEQPAGTIEDEAADGVDEWDVTEEESIYFEEDGGVVGADGEIISEEESSSGAPIGLLVLAGLGVLTVAGIAVARSDSRGTGGGSAPGHSSPHHHNHHSHSHSSVSGFSSAPSDSGSSSSSSGSDFGGGSSSGGGSSGSW